MLSGHTLWGFWVTGRPAEETGALSYFLNHPDVIIYALLHLPEDYLHCPVDISMAISPPSSSG